MVRLLSVTFDALAPETSARFWAALLDRRILSDQDGLLLPGSPTQVGLRFASAVDDTSRGRDLHLHVTSTSTANRHGIVEQVLELGGSAVDLTDLDAGSHIVMSDANGDPFCVIEPGNRWLTGTGLLGEVACDGSRALGLFWAEALEWPLVWDTDGETAVQHAEGGTKVAWGGPPLEPKNGPNPQRFELAATRPMDEEVARLVALGAVVDHQDATLARLRDPDDNEFVVRDQPSSGTEG